MDYLGLDYPTWAIPAEAFAPGAWAQWRRGLRRAIGLEPRSANGLSSNDGREETK